MLPPQVNPIPDSPGKATQQSKKGKQRFWDPAHQNRVLRSVET